MIRVPNEYEFVFPLSSNNLGFSYILKYNRNGKHYIAKVILKKRVGKKINGYIDYVKRMCYLKLPQYIGFKKVIDFEDSLFLIRPYIGLKTLKTYIPENKSMDLMSLLFIWKNIVISYYGIVRKGFYPDIIQPTNIFIDTLSCTYVTDIYRFPSDLADSLLIPKNDEIPYYPPEFITTEFIPDEKSVVWSLCNILYFIIKGKSLFTYTNYHTSATEKTEFIPEIIEELNSLPEFVNTIVKEGLDPIPMNRPPLSRLVEKCIEIEQEYKSSNRRSTFNQATPDMLNLYKRREKTITPNKVESNNQYGYDHLMRGIDQPVVV